MYRIAIVEDEEQFQSLFSEYVNRYATENHLEVSVVVFPDGLDLTEEYTAGFDVILMDIQMKHQDGMTAAKLVREHDEDVAIMFITTLAQYALFGYEVGATDYVLKPVEYEKFAFRFGRVLRQVKKKETENEYLILPTEDGQDRVNLRDVLYMDVDHHYLSIHLKNKSYRIRQTMGDMEKKLEGKYFVRCDRSIMVNLSAITKIGKDTVEVGDEVLPVSRSRKKAFMEAVMNYRK